MKTAAVLITFVMGVSNTFGSSTVSLSSVNTFAAEGRAMGLAVSENPSGSEFALLGVNNSDDMLYLYSVSGFVTGSIELDSLNGHCFGVVLNQTQDVIYTNDWEETDLFLTEDYGTTWSRVSDPAVNSGRGLTFDGNYYWTTDGYSGLLQFLPGTPPVQSFLLAEIYGQLSGLAVFPFQGNTGLAITTYSDLSIWFYEWDGVNLQFLGSAPCPEPCQASYGLAYSTALEHLFWSYKTSSGEYLISELSFEIDLSFTQNTWGGIKASF